MRRPSIIIIFFLSLLTIFKAIGEGEEYFDYGKTSYIMLYTPHEEGARFLSRPFDEGLPDSGKRFFQLVLPYLAQLEEITLPLPEPLYYFDIVSGEYMKRFSIGEAWIATGNQVTFITNHSDWNTLESIVRGRLDSTRPERITKTRVTERFLELQSEGAIKISEQQSLKSAIGRIGPYIYEQGDTHPDNLVNREKRSESRLHISEEPDKDGVALEGELPPEKDVSETHPVNSEEGNINRGAQATIDDGSQKVSSVVSNVDGKNGLTSGPSSIETGNRAVFLYLLGAFFILLCIYIWKIA